MESPGFAAGRALVTLSLDVVIGRALEGHAMDVMSRRQRGRGVTRAVANEVTVHAPTTGTGGGMVGVDGIAAMATAERLGAPDITRARRLESPPSAVRLAPLYAAECCGAHHRCRRCPCRCRSARRGGA